MTAPATDGATIPVAMLFAPLELEFAATRRLLERFPAEHADWRPHEKSMTLCELATHVAELPRFAAAIAAKPKWDGNVDKFERTMCRTAPELLAHFDESQRMLRDALATVDAASLEHEWSMGRGDTIFLKERRATLLPRTIFGHTAHHRGQLGVCYRLLGVPVPGMYGPSKDEGF